MEEVKRDLAEFRRLRNYYRKNFQNGEYDGSFLLWVEQMCEAETVPEVESKEAGE